MTNGDDNRRSFRVSEAVYLKHKMLTDDEFRNGIERYKLKSGINDGVQSKLIDIEARLSEAMYLLNGQQPGVGRCITLLNDKLNLIIDELPGLRESKSSLAQQPPQTCDVSADGIAFSTDSPMQIGDKVYVRFLLSTDNRYVESFCNVVRLSEPLDTSLPEFKYGIAVEFNNMPTAQREILIQHMFGRESETLRMRRLELDSVDING